MSAEAIGEVESEKGVLVLKRIHVAYRLQVDPGTPREAVERAYAHHPRECPVYRSLEGAIVCTTGLDLVEA